MTVLGIRTSRRRVTFLWHPLPRPGASARGVVLAVGVGVAVGRRPPVVGLRSSIRMRHPRRSPRLPAPGATVDLARPDPAAGLGPGEPDRIARDGSGWPGGFGRGLRPEQRAVAVLERPPVAVRHR